MKKIWVIFSFAVLLCLCSCGEKQPQPQTEETEASAQRVTQSSEIESLHPYWDVHADEIGSYAGLYAGQRFSGDFNELDIKYHTKDGSVMFFTPSILGLMEKKGAVNQAETEYVTGPQNWWHYYYDNTAKQIYLIYDIENSQDSEGYDVLKFKRSRTYYSETDYEWTCEDGYYKVKIETDDKFVVMEGIPGDDSNLYMRFYWKKNAGLIGVYSGYYNEEGEVECPTNLRYTSRTADGWNMAGTLQPYPFPNTKPKWPDKLWPDEHKGLDDPELRDILEQY
ncbi:MAG: hypothetical protein IJA87_10060 [Clostridia bacterium]|nr:hypothetical protein [Clostridia bacterium]